jgi:hypothetical protein
MSEDDQAPLAPKENGTSGLLSSRVLDAAWRNILEQTIPPETHELQVKTYKRFFYAGAKALVDNLIMSDTLDDTTDELSEVDGKRIDAIVYEVTAFFLDVAAGRQ